MDFFILVVEAKDLRWHAAGMIICFQTGVSQGDFTDYDYLFSEGEFHRGGVSRIILFQSHHPTVTSNATFFKSVSKYIYDYLYIVSS